MYFMESCEGISTTLLRALEKNESMLWFCKTCNPHILAQLEIAEKYKNDYNEMKDELKVIREEKDEAMEKLGNLMEIVEKSKKSTGSGTNEVEVELTKLKKRMEEFQHKIYKMDKKMGGERKGNGG